MRRAKKKGEKKYFSDFSPPILTRRRRRRRPDLAGTLVEVSAQLSPLNPPRFANPPQFELLHAVSPRGFGRSSPGIRGLLAPDWGIRVRACSELDSVGGVAEFGRVERTSRVGVLTR